MNKKPTWLKKRMNITEIQNMKRLLRSFSLNTVCEGANCPNIGECFNNKTATFMILGTQCTRNCKFCNVSKGIPEEINKDEPQKIANAALELNLDHVVITCVTRDDLSDGGANQFVKTIKAIRNTKPDSTIEVLISDLNGNINALTDIINASPNIINHNIETVPRLYDKVRSMANYERSLSIFKQVKALDPSIFTKSGLMVGLGETENEVIKVMDDLLSYGCEILTLGQYLSPSEAHEPIHEYIHPDQFEKYRLIALEKGFKYVASGPLVRSSYNAVEGMKKLNDLY